jgi:hypothetical protein
LRSFVIRHCERKIPGSDTEESNFYHNQGHKLLLDCNTKILTVQVSILALLLFNAEALPWNIPGHMVSGAIAYQILQRENPSTIPTVHSALEENPWYDTRWKPQLERLPDTERDEMLFMLAARWADDIRTLDKSETRLPWHYVDFPFKPEGDPASIQAMEPPQENILTALAENTRILRTRSDPAKRGVALAWLFHLVGDIHQPLLPNSSRGNIQTVIAVAVISAFVWLRIVPRCHCTVYGTA